MSRTIRNEERYAKKRRSEKSKLSKKYRNFKRGVTGFVREWISSEPSVLMLTDVAHSSPEQVLAAVAASEVAA
jgi:hypothetical protein